MAWNFCGSLFLRMLEFSSFAGRHFQEFGFKTLLLGIIFYRFPVWCIKVTKYGPSFSLHCLQPISLKFSSVNKRSKLLQNFFGQQFVFMGFNFPGSMKNPWNSWTLNPIKMSYQKVIPKIVIIKACILNQSINQSYSDNNLNPSKI